MSEALLLALLVFVAAILYSSVGHGGASGYLAAMALFSLAPEVMRPTALVLNILVASVGAYRFYRVGGFSWRVFWPFALGSIPFAFLGGTISLPGQLYKQVLGVVLVFAAFRLVINKTRDISEIKIPPLLLAILLGAGVGLLAGLTGVGGGIFLTPLLLFAAWATSRQASGISAAFILVNSIAGLGGQLTRLQFIPNDIYLWAGAALLGSLIGTELGTRRLSSLAFRRLLAFVLLIASYKLIFT